MPRNRAPKRIFIGIKTRPALWHARRYYATLCACMRNRKSTLLIEKDELVFNGKYIRVFRRHFRNRRTGMRGIWEMVQRKTYGRIVAIIALTQKNEVILTKIYRVPVRSWVIECCAGLMDKKGESEKSVARRELLEETGYAVSSLRELASGPFNAGLRDDEIVYYVGMDARKVQEPQLENAEDIEVLTVPLKKLPQLLLHPPRGIRVDVKLLGMLYLLEKLKNNSR